MDKPHTTSEIREMREDVQKKCCKINSSKLMTKDNGKEKAARKTSASSDGRNNGW